MGWHLVRALEDAGHRVRCLVRPLPRRRGREAPAAETVAGALEDEHALAALVAGADVVFHAAAVVDAPTERAFDLVNVEGTARVARAAHSAGVRRLVHVSSQAVTGPSAPGVPVDESVPPRPISAYARSKQRGEEEVRRSGVPFTIVRPPAVYGPRDVQFLALFRLARLGSVPVFGDGRQELSLVYAADLADALVQVAASPRTAGGTYHAAHATATTQRALAEAVAAAMGTRPRVFPLPVSLVRGAAGALAALRVRTLLASPGKVAEVTASGWACVSERIAADAGWRARTDLTAGLAQTAAWYRERGWL